MCRLVALQLWTSHSCCSYAMVVRKLSVHLLLLQASTSPAAHPVAPHGMKVMERDERGIRMGVVDSTRQEAGIAMGLEHVLLK